MLIGLKVDDFMENYLVGKWGIIKISLD